jgi:hypothetical protein
MGWSWDLMGGNGGRFHGEVVIFFCGNRDDMEDFIGNYSKEMVMNPEMVMKQRISWRFHGNFRNSWVFGEVIWERLKML